MRTIISLQEVRIPAISIKFLFIIKGLGACRKWGFALYTISRGEYTVLCRTSCSVVTDGIGNLRLSCNHAVFTMCNIRPESLKLSQVK